MAEMPSSWEMRGKPPTLFRRFAFGSYGETRAFLDALAALSEETGIHPQNINFGSTYANVTLEAAAGESLTEADAAFARRVDALVGGV